MYLLHAQRMGMDTNELKGLSQQEQQIKMQEFSRQHRPQPQAPMLEKRIAELQKKKADGAITEQEQKQLTQLEAMKKMRFGSNSLRPAPLELKKIEAKPDEKKPDEKK